MDPKNHFFSGTSNIVSPLKQSQFPPEFAGASRLTYYASLFSTVEVNATFYKLPQKATIEKWTNSVPEHFRFTFKVPKGVTHAKDLQFSSEELEVFSETVALVGDKKGCLLVQLPPKVSREKEEELAGLLECLKDNAPGWKIAVEFRHPSWYTGPIYRLLQGYGAGMVQHDMPRSITPKVEVGENFRYLRFHGPEGGYRGSYQDDQLKEQAERIRDWVKNEIDVFIYFNNTIGDALSNLQTMNKMVHELIQ